MIPNHLELTIYIAAEIWEATGEEGNDLMWCLCCSTWKKKEWPLDWYRTVFVSLPKKGNLKECDNHRTISLISHASKAFLKIIILRMKMESQQEIWDEQVGRTRYQIVTSETSSKNVGNTKILFICALWTTAKPLIVSAILNFGLPRRRWVSHVT